ncbi:hypothetical protein [Cellulomonas sp. Leaf334]|uniref:hypothetical protein n=1 Tax=Cellulomonas sp. Leaf334 TaxID=1736339 RepID=UPI000701FD7A|nr:hypothetical protein [Cellulomonas sp. Leaf334]KQR12209.1 hypothetical protein ASF78_13740 [Cellulomonas sp. Leaf334]
MEFTAVVAALLRRWYVVLVGLAMTAGLVYVANDAVPPTYSAAGSVLLLPPGASLEDGSNPLLALGGLEQPAALVVAYLAGDEARQLFAEDFPNTTYDIVLDPLSRGPLVLIKVEDPSEEDVMAALNAVLDTLPDALTMLQDQVEAPADSRVTSMPLSVDTRATTERSDSLRALIAAAGVGMVLTLVGAIAFDSLAARRREHLRAGAESTDAPEAAVAPDADGQAAPSSAATTAPPVPADPSVATAPEEPEPELPQAAQTTDEDATSWQKTAPKVQAQDFARSEERYGSQWPPRATDDPALDDEFHIVHRG